MRFEQWIDTLVEEKEMDPEQILEVEGPSGLNQIPLGVVIEAIKTAPAHEQKAIKEVVVWLDFLNADIVRYFRHLAQAIAI